MEAHFPLIMMLSWKGDQNTSIGWVLDHPSTVIDSAIYKLPQIEYNVLLREFSTVTETLKAIQHLSSGKAPVADAIPVEIYNSDGLTMAEKLTELVQCTRRKETYTRESNNASIIHLYKRKGSPQVCNNHRGISLLSIAGKIVTGNKTIEPLECAS